MFGTKFYNQTLRRYTAIFGTLFNDIQIGRSDNSGTEIQQMTVPINYAPMQKILASIERNRRHDGPAIVLPRMSFEIVNVAYDPERAINTRPIRGSSVGGGAVKTWLTPTPYDIEFELNIMAKYSEDGAKIIEQILPNFKPDFTVSARMVDGMNAIDVPIILNSVSKEDAYDTDFETRRMILWTLTFTMKGYFYGPSTDKKVIKFVDANVYSNMDANSAPAESVTVQPGLTANGEPTTDVNTSIDFNLINEDDDWAYIVKIEDE